MIRSRSLLVLAGLALAGLALVAGTAGCGDAPDSTKARMATPSVAPVSASASAPLTPERREALFLAATAAHLCSVQSRVYTDPSAMASAYASQPVYQDLTAEQVTEFQQRIVSEPAFADRLTRQIQQTCGTPK
ncbi:hypothetical protein GCM10010399_89180 [Dactylosporangium fulvum]|uniref:Uncharacterized protein n=1 Tax=Dactylosporangium fulvum TaxID=53359 RepID=A0ABY5W8A0_9ACTN|nr:hypothetical protein [Dactylosporangium fulvum]UWP84928.1 hypothetical protein Dfulv_12135 [Dactylosporangium fulvum]